MLGHAPRHLPPSSWRSSLWLSRVSLDDGPLRQQRDVAREDYLRIPNDDLLKGFRQRAGRPAPGVDLGGWYSSDIFHIFGQVLSGLARLHAVTGDPACREKAESLLKAWAETIEPDGYFFYSRKPNAPHYIYEKMVGGLTDLVLFCDSKLAAESLAKITGWAVKNLDRTNAYAFSGTEWYTLSENLYRAHRATGDSRYLDFARAWHYTEYWDVFARNGDLFGDRGNGMANRGLSCLQPRQHTWGRSPGLFPNRRSALSRYADSRPRRPS